MRREEFPRYLNHALGVVTSGAWLETYVKLDYKKTKEDNIILSERGSRYFKIGLPKFKNNTSVSLCVTQVEFDWLSKIVFDKAVIDLNNKLLILKVKPVFGDKKTMIDLKSFFVAFTFDSLEKLQKLSQYTSLSLRKYWIGEENNIRFTNGKAFWEIPLELGDVNNVIDETIQYETFDSLVNAKISSTNAYDVKFQGGYNKSTIDPELQKVLEPFNPNNYDRVLADGTVVRGSNSHSAIGGLKYSDKQDK